VLELKDKSLRAVIGSAARRGIDVYNHLLCSALACAAMTDTQTDPPLPVRQGQAWTNEEDRQLYDSFLAGQPINIMASVHQRSAGGIRARLRRLGLIDENGEVVEPPPPFAVPDRRRSSAMDGPRAADHKQPMRLIFAVTTADGWRIEIKSNRSLNKGMVERLTLMLQGGIADVEVDT
jgi:hypothetical protein